MKVFCSNDKKNNVPDGYDDYIDINCSSDIGFHFWDKKMKFNGKFSPLAVDLLYISVFVFAMDRKILRNKQLDNWTRTIELNVPVSNIDFWNSNKPLLEEMINFLSGDNWEFSFREKVKLDEDIYYKSKRYEKTDIKYYDKVCLLSGGLDSFIGAIDLLEEEKNKILFISHYGGGKGTKEYQDKVFTCLKDTYGLDDSDYIQFYVACKHAFEDTTRTRSFMFFSHAIVMASAFNVDTEMYIPENGFISLNIPLSGARFGSSSTRTTHPYYIKKLKDLVKKMELKISIKNPYQIKTKVEMVLECKNQELLKTNYVKTMSCFHPDLGRYSKHSETMHCGSCIPCIIRRAALFNAFGEDKTIVRDFLLTKSEVAKLNKNAFLQKIRKFKKSSAILEIQKSGVLDENLNSLAEMYCRGIDEINRFISEIIRND